MSKLGGCLIVLILATSAHGDYALPQVVGRQVLLVPAKHLQVTTRKDKDNITTYWLEYAHGDNKRRFYIDTFWMQDRIWSDGICVGVNPESPKSAESRCESVRKHLAAATKSEGPALPVLIEMVWTKKDGPAFVAYMKVFDAKAEHPRYFPEEGRRQYYDVIQIELDEDQKPPQDAEAFVTLLNAKTAAAMAALFPKEEEQTKD